MIELPLRFLDGTAERRLREVEGGEIATMLQGATGVVEFLGTSLEAGTMSAGG